MPQPVAIAHPDSLCLDPIRARLPLGDEAQKPLTFRRASNSVDVAAGAASKPLLYVLHSEGTAWVFDAAGKPLLIDLVLDAGGPPTPTHIIVTGDGRIGGCSRGAVAGTVASVWMERTRRGGAPEDTKTSQHTNHSLLPAWSATSAGHPARRRGEGARRADEGAVRTAVSPLRAKSPLIRLRHLLPAEVSRRRARGSAAGRRLWLGVLRTCGALAMTRHRTAVTRSARAEASVSA